MDWEELTTNAPIDWLLEAENPSVRYFTLTQLMGLDQDDESVIEARQLIADAPYTRTILADQFPDGHWGTPERYFEKHTGTAWRWLLLHELGFDPYHPQMRKAARFLLDIAYYEREGGFTARLGSNPVPCYGGWLLWGFYRCGLGDDERVQRSLQWVVDNMKYVDGDDTVPDPDNGCWGRHTCVRGVIPILRALTERPPAYRTQDTDRVLGEGVEFILKHRVYKRSTNPAKPMNAKLTQLTFPTFYWPDFVEVLLVLTHLGLKDKRMTDAITYLQKKRAKDGRWKLQRTYNERSKHDMFRTVVPLEPRSAPSKWVTLRALIALKRWFNGEVRWKSAAQSPSLLSP
jgi:hypothetical protein